LPAAKIEPEKKIPEKKPLTVRRPAIEGVTPEIDAGRFPIKRTVGEDVVVQADVFADGHDALSAVLLYRPDSENRWREAPMRFVDNDRWQGQFRIAAQTTYFYSIEAWVDPFQSWVRGLIKKYEAGQDVALDVRVGAELAQDASKRAMGTDARSLAGLAAKLNKLSAADLGAAVAIGRGAELAALMQQYPDRRASTTYEKQLSVNVDREKARFSAWYEMFPRSCASDPKKSGTFRDCIARLDYIAQMGFDVLYLPPIHPIGVTERKGKNNTTNPAPEDKGSPWAIGAKEGGHKSIHPELGTLEDFQELLAKARERGIELALDIAYQCSPDHPYVKEHPEWFQHRPDGSIQYAENPPKKYQDIYPFHFEGESAAALREELKSVVLYWASQGVRIFRIDNPHTKPFVFWEWLIAGVRREYPDAIFLAEAFTRPKVMYRLAKLGFTQSYTYFAWRTNKAELTEYLTELTQPPVRDFFRMNLWPNTPDILTEPFQSAGRPVFMSRVVLAATLSATYGIYGPAYELCENRAVAPGTEEYLDSEKYQIRVWDIDRADSLRGLIADINRIRRENPALQSNGRLRFHPVDNERLIAYSKMTQDASNRILVVVNLDPRGTQSGFVEVPMEEFGLAPDASFEVEDLLTGARYAWRGSRNYVALSPEKMPAHILRVRA
jgi:starch synthase (maltosyl-transferring)